MIEHPFEKTLVQYIRLYRLQKTGRFYVVWLGTTLEALTFQGYVKGYYRMADETPCMDVNASYFIAMERPRIDELVEILQTFINKTLQEALYLEIHDNVEFRFIKRGGGHDPAAS